MALSRDSLPERQLKLIRRAQFRLKQALERLQWEEKELYPEIERLKAGKSVFSLGDGVAFDIEVISDENQNPPPAEDAR